MSAGYRLSHTAQEELEEIFLYISEHSGPERSGEIRAGGTRRPEVKCGRRILFALRNAATTKRATDRDSSRFR